MRKEYDFTKLRPARANYTKHLKKSLTLRLDPVVIEHFKMLAEKTGLPYQSLINFVLREYANAGLEPSGNWDRVKRRKAG